VLGLLVVLVLVVVGGHVEETGARAGERVVVAVAGRGGRGLAAEGVGGEVGVAGGPAVVPLGGR